MIITLCGSARFEAWYHMWNEALGLAGHACFGLCSYPSMYAGEREWYSPEEKTELDHVHFDKIKVSDGVLFLNVMAYMGESTLREFAYAKALRKKIFFLESWGKGCGIGGNHYDEAQQAFARFGLKGGSPVSTVDWPAPWDLLGLAGDYRSKIVERLGKREVEALGYDIDELDRRRASRWRGETR